MARTRATLHVFMNGYRVGMLARPAGGDLTFSYDPRWRISPGSRPISLSLPLERSAHHGDVVYNFIDNLLPDNPEIRLRIQRRFSCPTSHPFDLLRAIGADCVGALQFVEDESAASAVRSVTAARLRDAQIEQLLRIHAEAPLGMTREHNDFRISIAGAQEKTALLFYRGKWHLPTGATPTSHILKLPIGALANRGIDLSDSCENEWLCMNIAAAFGLPAAEVVLRAFGSVTTLVVARFDRQWASDGSWLMRLPQEDMCQAMGCSPGLKYECDGGPGIVRILELLKRSRSAVADQEVFLKAHVLFWLLAAIDGHGKNFSIRLLPGGGFTLTPLYDILSAHPLFDRRQLDPRTTKMAMALSGTRKRYYNFRQIQPRLFRITAERAGCTRDFAEHCVNEMLERVDDAIDIVQSKLPPSFPARLAESVFAGMKKIRGAAAAFGPG